MAFSTLSVETTTMSCPSSILALADEPLLDGRLLHRHAKPREANLVLGHQLRAACGTRSHTVLTI